MQFLRNLKINPLLLGILMVLLFYSHYLWLGQDSVWYANDYMELIVHWYKLLIDSGAMFQPNAKGVEGMLGILPRGSYASEFSLMTWIFYSLDTFHAVLFNKLLIHLIAYLAAYYFLISLTKDIIRGPVYLYALFWACSPFWPEAGVGLAFVPVLFVVFYKLAQGERLRLSHVFLLIIYCFYSIVYLNGVFVLAAIALAGCYDLLIRKYFTASYWLALALLFIAYLGFNYRLFDIYYFQRDWFVPHRVEFDIYSFGRYHDAFWAKLFQILFMGQVHAMYISPLVYVSLMGYMMYLLRQEGRQAWKRHRLMIGLFLGIHVVALLAALFTYLPLVERIPLVLKINQFSFERFYFLIYPIMLFLFVLMLDQLLHLGKKYSKQAAFVLGLSVLSYNFFILDDNVKNQLIKPMLGIGEKYPTYRQFFAEEQFEEIKAFLVEDRAGEVKYRVGSIGMHPAIASYNGLHAIDGYTSNYPLAYKHLLYEVLEQELGLPDKENWLYWHFQGWGNKAYLFNHTLGDDFMRFKWRASVEVKEPKYNYEKLRSLGCEYVLSAVPVIDPHLNLKKVFTHDNSAWDVHLYEVVF
ncbi:DUF6044 family protein [Belliella sp. DSM 111904]|uniref:DUF6044 family protein n=1 Tax=Belliella filtrata TaxID=2923435 RepID=A0ABS9UWV7_9BACT|nr:DUF6044 family protein [Belliella filtrata]MCH7408656.1 DUF6044 family protein [Belliella filtrata]